MTLTPDDWLRRLIENHRQGRARFPTRMNLADEEWRRLLERLALPDAPRSPALRRQDALLADLLAPRRRECDQLAAWLRQYMTPAASPMHQSIAGASMSFNHLWQDLGLSSRGELRLLMTDCFAPLVEMNVRNMRWKKFFYRQVCLAREGEFACRSPSCEECSEIAYCFAPEI